MAIACCLFRWLAGIAVMGLRLKPGVAFMLAEDGEIVRNYFLEPRFGLVMWCEHGGSDWGSSR